MRIAISGSQGTGKSTLIAAFLARCPGYAHEPEAFELLADDISFAASEGPDAEGLAILLQHTISVLDHYPAGTDVIVERSPIDYLAYATAILSLADSERRDLLRAWIPRVRASLTSLDLIVLLPITNSIALRPEDDEAFRDRVDDELRRALIEDCHDLFPAQAPPLVLELPTAPTRQLAELLRRVRPRA